MKKYFVVSDVHGFFNELKEALDKAGFDKNNPEHVFVSCGDFFDRGNQARECLDFVMSLPKERRILVMGNHDENLYQLISGKRVANINDAYNGTIDTIKQFLGNPKLYNTVAVERRKDLLSNKKLMQYFDELKDYYANDKYIFVHGWLPWYTESEETDDFGFNEKDVIIYDFDSTEWHDARWANGFEEWEYIRYFVDKYGYELKDPRTVVCGHWHTSYAHSKFHGNGREYPRDKENWREDTCFDPFYDKGIIGLDACTALTRQVNVVVLDDLDC